MLHKLTILMLMGISLCGFASEWIVIPHVAADTGSFQTRLVFENRSDAVLVADMLIYNNDQVADSKSMSLEPHTRTAFLAQDLFPGKNVTHLFVIAYEGLFAGVEYTPVANPDNRTYIEGIRNFSQRWRIHPSNWKTTYDGLAVVGPGCYQYDVTITQYSASGAFIAAVPLGENSLQGFGKMVLNLGDVFREQEGSYVEINANNSIAVMGLKGTFIQEGGGFLLGNQAEPYPVYEELMATLAVNRDLWNSSSLSSNYVLQTANTCFCPYRPVSLEVESGNLVSIAHQDGSPVPLGEVHQHHTINELFSMIDDAAMRGADGITVSWNEQYGYPENIWIDWLSCAVDEESGVVVTSVQPR